MDASTLNYPAIVVAALSGFLLGAVWYSPLLFANAWLKGAGLTNDEVAKGNKAKIFGSTFILFLIMAFVLALFVNHGNAAWGAGIGFHAGLLTFSAIAIHSLFELKGWKLILINGCYSFISLIIMGAILGAWQ
ncbi:DUF1761 domain-containing protein [Mucilaginibacter terrae]|uniref:DUF1761 domain-containing protein n=1 Tax=Mucilaginibacter terrae TaxID=1955052 RepID=A0ABU3GZ48_9SPHI|nr:DUF1761 domain-containing protein [Mucilaginibacter terrae]MDT3404891.1 hypothetical protein [Mucilaginibacter terrae]